MNNAGRPYAVLLPYFLQFGSFFEENLNDLNSILDLKVDVIIHGVEVTRLDAVLFDVADNLADGSTP
jgi:hypothetical protein